MGVIVTHPPTAIKISSGCHRSGLDLAAAEDEEPGKGRSLRVSGPPYRKREGGAE